jgi:hypothetical protein
MNARFLAIFLILPGSMLLLTAQQAPIISAIADQTVDEDTVTPLIAFRIADPDTALTSLTLTKLSSNTNVVPLANVVLGGAGTNRSVRVGPRRNAFGDSTIVLTVSDGQRTTSSTIRE